mmetsp:Transcript_33411/g.88861  ORF Transcript_33411/g.88861 Transcript_33411/m.88861 type:complete len:224 (+) Transcript_33411:455-1126(+)
MSSSCLRLSVRSSSSSMRCMSSCSSEYSGSASASPGSSTSSVGSSKPRCRLLPSGSSPSELMSKATTCGPCPGGADAPTAEVDMPPPPAAPGGGGGAPPAALGLGAGGGGAAFGFGRGFGFGTSALSSCNSLAVRFSNTALATRMSPSSVSRRRLSLMVARSSPSLSSACTPTSANATTSSIGAALLANEGDAPPREYAGEPAAAALRRGETPAPAASARLAV